MKIELSRILLVIVSMFLVHPYAVMASEEQVLPPVDESMLSMEMDGASPQLSSSLSLPDMESSLGDVDLANSLSTEPIADPALNADLPEVTGVSDLSMESLEEGFAGQEAADPSASTNAKSASMQLDDETISQIMDGTYVDRQLLSKDNGFTGSIGFSEDMLAIASAVQDSYEKPSVYTGTDLEIERTGTDNDFYQASMDSVLMQLNGKQAFSLSDAINDLMATSIPTVATITDISDLHLNDDFDVGVLNMQYQVTVGSVLAGWEKDTALAGKSESAVSVFKNTYGDLAETATLNMPKIPNDFNPNDMMATAARAINSQYADATSAGTFKTIKEFTGLSRSFELFNTAKNEIAKGSGVDPSMLTANLSSMLSTASGPIAETIQGEYNARSSGMNIGAGVSGAQNAFAFYSGTMKGNLELNLIGADGRINLAGATSQINALQGQLNGMDWVQQSRANFAQRKANHPNVMSGNSVEIVHKEAPAPNYATGVNAEETKKYDPDAYVSSNGIQSDLWNPGLQPEQNPLPAEFSEIMNTGDLPGVEAYYAKNDVNQVKANSKDMPGWMQNQANNVTSHVSGVLDSFASNTQNAIDKAK